MAIWFELIVVLLVAYATGLGIGWLKWGNVMPQDEVGPDSEASSAHQKPNRGREEEL
jgi:hypothetical protein